MLILHLGCSLLAPSIWNIEMFLFSKTLRDSAAWMSSIANKEAYRHKNALNTACKHSFILCRITKLKIILNPRIYEYVNIFLLNVKCLRCHCKAHFSIFVLSTYSLCLLNVELNENWLSDCLWCDISCFLYIRFSLSAEKMATFNSVCGVCDSQVCSIVSFLMKTNVLCLEAVSFSPRPLSCEQLIPTDSLAAFSPDS